jgi:hypothetical protein
MQPWIFGLLAVIGTTVWRDQSDIFCTNLFLERESVLYGKPFVGSHTRGSLSRQPSRNRLDDAYAVISSMHFAVFSSETSGRSNVQEKLAMNLLTGPRRCLVYKQLISWLFFHSWLITTGPNSIRVFRNCFEFNYLIVKYGATFSTVLVESLRPPWRSKPNICGHYLALAIICAINSEIKL